MASTTWSDSSVTRSTPGRDIEPVAIGADFSSGYLINLGSAGPITCVTEMGSTRTITVPGNGFILPVSVRRVDSADQNTDLHRLVP